MIGVDTRDSAGRQTGPPGSIGDREFRRTIYVQVRRSLPLGFTEPFDVPLLTPNCELRRNSTSSQQSLALMNSEFMVKQTEMFADRVVKEAGGDRSARVKRAWAIAYGIEPSAEDLARALSFLADQEADLSAAAPSSKPERTALATLGLAFFGSNAFLYID